MLDKGFTAQKVSEYNGPFWSQITAENMGIKENKHLWVPRCFFLIHSEAKGNIYLKIFLPKIEVSMRPGRSFWCLGLGTINNCLLALFTLEVDRGLWIHALRLTRFTLSIMRRYSCKWTEPLSKFFFLIECPFLTLVASFHQKRFWLWRQAKKSKLLKFQDSNHAFLSCVCVCLWANAFLSQKHYLSPCRKVPNVLRVFCIGSLAHKISIWDCVNPALKPHGSELGVCQAQLGLSTLSMCT